jgi:hypothetical protein
MASILKRNKQKWKGVKWIDTPFAIPYKRRRAYAMMAASGIFAAGVARINAIRQSNRNSKEKAIAIAETVIKSQQAGIKVFDATMLC